MTGLGWLDRAYGSWDKTICDWWSYAAGWGNYTALGPFFVAAPADHALPTRAVVTARTYATAGVRGHPVPTGRLADTFYLRQCSRITDQGDQPDKLIWRIPQMIRSLLAPGSATVLNDAPHRLEPGDIISLGTPGGSVITAKSQGFYDFVDIVLFWWSSRDWHDVFFGKDKELYLHHGDQVFFWAQGLGYQRHDVRRR
jgi:hypothetical protein